MLVLDKFVVTKKRELQLPVRVKPTLENFFYGNGTILEGKRSSLVLEPNGAGPDGEGLVSINLKIKF